MLFLVLDDSGIDNPEVLVILYLSALKLVVHVREREIASERETAFLCELRNLGL